MIRKYTGNDFYKVATLLIQSHTFDNLTANLVNEKLDADPDQNPNTRLVYEENNEIIGFILGVTRTIREVKYGFIKLIAVQQPHRRKGIGKLLYYDVEAQFKIQGITIVRIYDVPLNYFMPGIDPRYTPAICWAERLGFKKFGDTPNMDVNLNQNWDTACEINKLKSQNIVISRATPNDKEALFDFVKQEWLLWLFELEMAYKSNPVSLFIAHKNNEIKAFSAYDGNNKGTGWFGPMGTHPDLRGSGIGSVLLKLCLNDMKNAGLSTSIIPWVGPHAFYAYHANAHITRVFWRYMKEI